MVPFQNLKLGSGLEPVPEDEVQPACSPDDSLEGKGQDPEFTARAGLHQIATDASNSSFATDASLQTEVHELRRIVALVHEEQNLHANALREGLLKIHEHGSILNKIVDSDAGQVLKGKVTVEEGALREVHDQLARERGARERQSVEFRAMLESMRVRLQARTMEEAMSGGNGVDAVALIDDLQNQVVRERNAREYQMQELHTVVENMQTRLQGIVSDIAAEQRARADAESSMLATVTNAAASDIEEMTRNLEIESKARQTCLAELEAKLLRELSNAMDVAEQKHATSISSLSSVHSRLENHISELASKMATESSAYSLETLNIRSALEAVSERITAAAAEDIAQVSRAAAEESARVLQLLNKEQVLRGRDIEEIKGQIASLCADVKMHNHKDDS